MNDYDDILEAIPEANEINDEILREKTLDAWLVTIEESKFDNIDEIPWATSELSDQTLIRHVREVTTASLNFANMINNARQADVDVDAVLCGSLLHDISQVIEYTNEEVNKLIPHPHYSIQILGDVGLPFDVQHIVLSHTPLSSVEPQTIEAEIVFHMDHLVAQGTFWTELGELTLTEYYD
jgi:putative nucleotidyltransferase with HDIG domain